jgi:hypothetical protein
MYVCERCSSSYQSARAASIELCPRCLLRDDVASPLRYRPQQGKPPQPRAEADEKQS